MNQKDARTIGADRDLLSLARSVLDDEGFLVEEVEHDVTIVLAENRYFLVGVVATPTIAQMLLAEGSGEAILDERLAAADPGPKRWDAYLVLLTQEVSPGGSPLTKELFDINYDTAGLRRIVHAGVENSAHAIRQALSPFLAPVELDDPAISADAFEAFIEELAARGLERGVAARAVEAVRQGVPLGDAI